MFKALLQQTGAILLISHQAPDGDTLGASLALYAVLQRLGRTVTVYCPDAIPTKYAFLPNCDRVVNTIEGTPDLAVFIDCGDAALAGSAAQLLGQVPTMCIDHHATNTGYADRNLLDYAASSTCEVLALALFEQDAPITPDIADCLYCGMLTDSGQFAFDSTSSRTLRTAAMLVDCGARLSALNRILFRQRSMGGTLLIGRAIYSMELHTLGAISLMQITHQDFERSGAVESDFENIINYGVEVDGVRIALLMREQLDGSWKISFRTKDELNAGQIAAQLGGGGHRRAAGCTLQGDQAQVRERLLQVVGQALQA